MNKTNNNMGNMGNGGNVTIFSSDLKPKRRIETLKCGDHVRLRNDVSKGDTKWHKAKSGEIAEVISIDKRHIYFLLKFKDMKGELPAGRSFEVHANQIELLPNVDGDGDSDE